ncbi:MAG TPA: hypothetical protein VK763_14440 [Terriglobales bacterium]|jgi:hypothetical protein|nr:hypothetical protein [Terriglobales bacterium]
MKESEKIKPVKLATPKGTLVYSTEQMLVDQFVYVLGNEQNPWGPVAVSCEFFYSRGRTDVLALASDDTLIAFEAKLKDWRCALDQAYRNLCFAHKSYVVVPKATALIAFGCIAEFKRRGVGLCYVDNSGGLTVLEESETSIPIEPWIATQATCHIRSDSEAA